MCRCADVVIHLRAPKRISLGRHIRVGGAYAQRVLFWPMEAVHLLPCYEPTSIMQPVPFRLSKAWNSECDGIQLEKREALSIGCHISGKGDKKEDT